ncbi:hypothetical protein SSX86_022826 [Deinandra increscens subsp. villosa]|uniref:cellulase n=1 Tax=Deinandra increscens subsp. villosa TaxID=3103831 RepID=A0AAP0CJS1_9ASTR
MTTRRRVTVTTLYPRSSAFKAVEKESEKGDTEDLGTRRELTCSSAKVDLVGGYYDAGNNVKFGLPMAFTTTMLAWSITEFGDNMKSELGNAKAALPWSSYYLVKASTATPYNLYVQVRHEDMDTPRNVYKVSTQNPGSDVAAETAAALVAAP